MPELRIHLLRTTAELEAFAPAWRALYEADPEATPFQHPAWLIPWWRQFGQPELRAIVLSRAEVPVGLLPLYIYSDPPNRERHLLPLGVGTTDYVGGVFAPTCTAADIRLALELLAEDAGWDTLHLPQLRPGSRLLEALAAIPSAQPFDAQPCSRMRAVPMTQLPGRIRQNAMYYRKRAARQGNLVLNTIDASGIPATFDALVRMHTERWQQAGQPGVFADSRVTEWHREALPLLNAAGLLRLSTLTLNDEVIGVLYSLADPPGRSDRTRYVYLTAYSGKYADVGPGTVLLALAIEEAAHQGITTIDMLRGDEPYKRLWHFEPTPTKGVSIPHPARIAVAA